MKTTNIFLLSFILLLAGCSLFEKVSKNGKMHVVEAGYNDWSQAPQRGDVPEKGTDLAIIVQNWPEGATPQHIIFEKHKSLGAEINNRSEVGVVINARIVRASTKLPQTSEEVDLSDRLVYTDSNGDTQFIEIEEWTRLEDESGGDE